MASVADTALNHHSLTYSLTLVSNTHQNLSYLLYISSCFAGVLLLENPLDKTWNLEATAFSKLSCKAFDLLLGLHCADNILHLNLESGNFSEMAIWESQR